MQEMHQPAYLAGRCKIFMKTVRTRIAPSPTGEDIHIGNLYTALINFAVAKKHDGEFIIRIEDTDRTRFQEGAEAKILRSVNAYGLRYDEGPDIGGKFAPYRQSERLPLYKKYAEELISKGTAYYCFCTKDRLDGLRNEQQLAKKTPRYDKYCLHHVSNAAERIASGESYVIRLNVVPGKKMSFNDVIRGEIIFNSDEVDDQVLMKSDGYPTYHLGVVIDDHLMEISHVIRAEEWISSTPKHVLLYESFGWELPLFAHLPILRNPDKSKLSKRKNAVWASWYLSEGYLREAVINYLSLMSWSHPEGKELFSLDEFIQLFSLDTVHTTGPVFDIQKLEWMNGVYIREVLTEKELLERLSDFYKDDQDILNVLQDGDVTRRSRLLELTKTRMKTLKDFQFFLKNPVQEDRYENEQIELAKYLYEKLTALHDASWEEAGILRELKLFCAEKQVSMRIAYVLLTGNPQGLPLPQFMEYLGKEKTLERLRRYF